MANRADVRQSAGESAAPIRQLAAILHRPTRRGLNNELIVPLEHPLARNAKIDSTERLGGLLRYYRRVA